MHSNRTMLGLVLISALGIGYILLQIPKVGASSAATVMSPGLWQFTIEERQTIKAEQIPSTTTSFPARTRRSCQRKAAPFKVSKSNIGDATCTFTRYSVGGAVDVDEVCKRPDGITQRHTYAGSVTGTSMRVTERIEGSGQGMSSVIEKTTVARLVNATC